MNNQRAFFRLDFDSVPVEILHSFEGTITTHTLKLRDLSAGGLSVYAPLNVTFDGTYGFQFTLNIYDEKLKLEGKLVRKVEEKLHRIYAFEFSNMTEDDRKELAAKMLRYAIKKRQEEPKNN